MLLVIDCGNTNVVFAVRDGEAWRGIWRVRTDAQRTSDEYGVWLMSLFGHVGLKRDDISAAVIGTVVPAALYHLRRLCRDWFNIEPLVARSTLDWGFDIRVVNPAEVGADRLLNTLAAHRRFGGPLIIVDFGTATTFDVVDKDGAYLGGVICPGINLSLEALHQAAAQLPRIGIAQAAGGDRPPDRARHAVRRLLGLCRNGRGPRRPHQGGVRRADEGGRHRRPRAAGRRGHHGDRADRARSHPGRAAHVGGAQSRAHIAARQDHG